MRLFVVLCTVIVVILVAIVGWSWWAIQDLEKLRDRYRKEMQPVARDLLELDERFPTAPPERLKKQTFPSFLGIRATVHQVFAQRIAEPSEDSYHRLETRVLMGKALLERLEESKMSFRAFRARNRRLHAIIALGAKEDAPEGLRRLHRKWTESHRDDEGGLELELPDPAKGASKEERALVADAAAKIEPTLEMDAVFVRLLQAIEDTRNAGTGE